MLMQPTPADTYNIHSKSAMCFYLDCMRDRNGSTPRNMTAQDLARGNIVMDYFNNMATDSERLLLKAKGDRGPQEKIVRHLNDLVCARLAQAMTEKNEKANTDKLIPPQRRPTQGTLNELHRVVQEEVRYDRHRELRAMAQKA